MLRHKGNQKKKRCQDKEFVCRDIVGEVLEEECRDIAGEFLEEECRDIPYFIATLIKENGNGTMSRYFTTLSQHKELKMEDEL